MTALTRYALPYAPGCWSLRRDDAQGVSWRAGWDDAEALKDEVRPLLPLLWPGERVACGIEECRLQENLKEKQAGWNRPAEPRYRSRFLVVVRVLE